MHNAGVEDDAERTFAPAAARTAIYGEHAIGPGQAAAQFFSDYARQRPEVVAMWAFGIGFVLGWKIKPW